MTDRYESPLASRYASDAMLELFSAKTRACTWRKLWVQLAKAEMELGLPITQAQVDELAQHTDTIDFAAAARLERETRHDVMAHIRAYGLDCPSAAGIIHLGATSCYVTDNADLILYRQALCYLRKGLLRVIRNLAQFALRYKDLPTLGYTHLQPAQPVTVGKRACLWLQDLWLDLEELDEVTEAIRFLGCRGTTGTEASFLDLFDVLADDGDAAAADGDDDDASANQIIDDVLLDDVHRLRGGNDLAIAAASVLDHGVALFCGDLFCRGFVVEGTDGLRRILEGRVVLVDQDLGDDRRDVLLQAAGSQLVADGVLQMVADVALAHRAAFREGHLRLDGASFRCRAHAQVDHTNLRAVAMGDDDFIALLDQVDNGLCGFRDQLELFLGGVAECIAAQCNHNTGHNKLPLLFFGRDPSL